MEKRNAPSFGWIYALAFVAIAVALSCGIYLLGERGIHNNATLVTGAALLASGAMGFIGLLIALPITLSLSSSRQSTERHQEQLIEAMGDRLQQVSVLMNLMSEQQLLSDRAKSVAFREKDREAVRRAVQEEIGRQDWEAAMVLANDIETYFGYKSEADRFREEITAKRHEVQRRQIADLLVPLDRHIKGEAWGSALQEAQRIMAQFPDDEAVQQLPQEIENRRQMRKKQLMESWQDAVNRHDVDGSIEILKKLDLYLTPAEAEAMQATARNVFKEKREALRTRFSLAVQEHKWAEAIRLGDEIISEFPNTRIAQEVREKMEALRQRAGEPEEMVKA